MSDLDRSSSQTCRSYVVIKLSRWVGRSCGPESDGDEGRANSGGPGGLAVCSILVKGFIDDIPRVHLALVSSSNVGNMVLHDGNQGSIVKSTVADPAWEL
jgi:hypothetical protein